MTHSQDVQAAEAVVLRAFLPPRDRRSGVVDMPDAVEDEQRPPVDGDVTGIAERGTDVVVEPVGPVFAVALSDEHLGVLAIPPSRPVLVPPADRKGEVDRRVFEEVAQRRVEERSSVEPVVVHHEPVDAVLGRQRGLGAHHVGIRQVIASEFAGLDRLQVILVERSGTIDVHPVGEPRPPPDVVLGDLVELRQIEGEHLRPAGRPSSRAAQPRRDVAAVDGIEP